MIKKSFKDIDLIEMFLNDGDFGINATGLVDKPAIEKDWITLAAQKIKLAEVDKERRVLMGPLLIPNKPILRFNEETEKEYYIFFSEDTVREASERFQSNAKQNNASIQHLFKIDGTTVVEIWIVDDPKMDKSNLYDIDVPKGTCMISMKVYDDELWDDYIKTGILKGFSIEGKFSEHNEKLSEITEWGIILRQIEKILE